MIKELKTYLNLCTQYYDLALPKDTSEAISFYMQYAIDANGPILEPMCGTGRILIPIIEAGLDISGFDASIYMLNSLKRKYATISQKVPPVWQQFIEDFNSDKKFKLIFIPFGSWGLISDVENSKKCLEIMFNHLESGGKFIIEVDTVASAPKKQNIWHRNLIKKSDGSSIALNTLPSYNPETQIYKAICRYELIKQNQIIETEIEDFQMYLYQFEELDKLLQNIGFIEIKKYQDYKKTPANENSNIIIYECLK